MTIELATTSLSQAREARGLTLEDAERSTRISRRFLVALEQHDYSVFPAPIYARGFLRTYCRYLGVDPEHQLAELPDGWAASPPTTHLPPVPRGTTSFNPAWVLAGFILVALVGLGIFLGRSGNELGASDAQAGDDALTIGASTPDGSGRVVTPSASPTATAQSEGARSLDAGLPGILPDFTDVAVDDVVGFLESQDIPYLRIDTASASTEAGLVTDQSPEPGSLTGDIAQVTLTVSAGLTVREAARTDCDVLQDSNRRTAAEQAYFEENCMPPLLPDRTDCEEIRGTDYRSGAERSFFLANCILQ